MFDPTYIALMITVLTPCVGIMAFLWKIRSDVNVIAVQVSHFDENVTQIKEHVGNFESNVQTQLQKVTDVLTSVARQDERLNAMTVTLTALQAGQLSLSERLSYLASGSPKKRNA